jgi:uncharacterized protein (TIGR02246 family)
MTDRESIQQLVAIYARALDARDYETIADCFAQDATAEFTGFSGAMQGREAIDAHMKKALGPLATTQHIFTNFIIDIDGDSATLYCDAMGQHVTETGEDAETYLSGGKYNAEMRRRDGRWQFQKLVANAVWGMGDREMLPRKD